MLHFYSYLCDLVGIGMRGGFTLIVHQSPSFEEWKERKTSEYKHDSEDFVGTKQHIDHVVNNEE